MLIETFLSQFLNFVQQTIQRLKDCFTFFPMLYLFTTNKGNLMCERKEMEFAVFMFHQLAETWNKPAYQVYQILKQSDILDSYIIKNYDTLHTMGSLALIEDLTSFVQEKGYQL